MKTTFFSIITFAFGLAASAKGEQRSTITTNTITENIFATGDIVKDYLTIKNALVKSNSKAAAQGAASLDLTLNGMNISQWTTAQKQVWALIAVEAKKQTKTIAANNGKLDKQRKAFQQLSKAINDMVTNFGSTQKLYQDFCPMYEGGSIWLSETKDIKNPYYGAQMLTCGRINETDE